jgi:hypothetical protein
MACNLRRIANLPVDEEFKLTLLDFFQRPENQAACERLNEASDEELVAMVQQIGTKLKGPQAPQGQPPGMQQPAPGPASQGIASMQQPTRPPVQPGVPPGQVADIPKPMDTPLGIRAVPPRRY